MTTRDPAPDLTEQERCIVRRFDEAPDGLLEDGQAYHIVRVRLDRTRHPCASKRTTRGAVGVADTLASLSGARYLVLGPDGTTVLHDTAPEE